MKRQDTQFAHFLPHDAYIDEPPNGTQIIGLVTVFWIQITETVIYETNKIYKYDGNSGAGYLQRCSAVVVICMVSPVTRCSTTFASNDTT